MTLTLVVSKDPRGLGEAVILRALSQMSEKILVLDGGNCVNPYALARVAQRRRIAPSHVLSRVVLSRAFTAHQLDELVKRALVPALAAHHTERAVVLRPLAPFKEVEAPHVFESLVRGLVEAAKGATIECVDGVEALCTSLGRAARLEEISWEEHSERSPTSSASRSSGGRSFGGRCAPRTSRPSTRC